MDCAADRARRRQQRSPLNALVEFDLWFGLGEWIVAEIDRDRIVLPRRWVSCVGAANDQTRMVWAGAQAEQESAAPGRAEEITGGRAGSPMCSRIARTEGVSMTKAMIVMSAPQYRQVRGNCSNSRAMSVAHR